MYWLRPRNRRFPLWFIVILLLGLLPAGPPPIVAAQPPAPPGNAPAPPAITFTKTAQPAEVRPGDVITYTLTVTNRADAPLSGAVLTDPLPAGVTYVPGSAGGGRYDPATGTLTWALPDLAAGATATLTFQAQVAQGAPNPILNVARLSHPDWPQPFKATAATHVLYTTEAVITPGQGGRLTAPGGRVTVDFPAGAVDQAVRVNYQSLDARALPQGRTDLALQFALTAHPADAAGAPPITRFQKPLRLTVDLTGLVDVAALGKYQKIFVGYRDEATGRWVHLPVVEQQFDRPVLTVEVDHFSTFGGGADGEMEWGRTLTFNEATVGPFDGGLGYSYPLQVVPGRAGLTPQLNLSYNSRRMDGVLSWVQSDWTGLGWTVDTVEILRKGVERCWQNNWICYKNEFVLVLNGTTYELKPQTAGQDFGRYHTEDEQFLYIERRNAAGSNGSSQNTTGEYWIVRTKDGTEYELGKKADAEQVFGPYAKSGGQPAFGYVGTHPTLAAFRWRVDQVTDPHGNHIDYTYYEETKAYQCANEPAWPSCQGVLDDNSERASYLDRIKYNYHSRPTVSLAPRSSSSALSGAAMWPI